MGGAGGRGLSESRQHGSLGGKSRRVTVEKVKRSRGPVFKKFTSVHKDKAPKFTQRQPTSRRCFFFSPKNILCMYKQVSISVPLSLYISSHPSTQMVTYRTVGYFAFFNFTIHLGDNSL